LEPQHRRSLRKPLRRDGRNPWCREARAGLRRQRDGPDSCSRAGPVTRARCAKPPARRLGRYKRGVKRGKRKKGGCPKSVKFKNSASAKNGGARHEIHLQRVSESPRRENPNRESPQERKKTFPGEEQNFQPAKKVR